MADPISAGITAIVTAAASATTGAVLGLTGSASLAALAGNAVLGLASWQTALSLAGFAASALLTPDVGFEGSPTQWRADVNVGVPFILGRKSVAGSIVHRDEWGEDNRYQSIWTVYSGGGPINSFEQFYLDDIAVNFAGANGEASTSGYTGKAWLQTVTGVAAATALAQTGLAAATPTYQGWSGSSALPYRAASMITLYQDSKGKSWPAGEPAVRTTIEGVLCYDPRLDSTVAGGSGTHRSDDPSTWSFSENAALNGLKVAIGIYEGSDLVGGIGAGVDGVDLPAFMEWANVCDANGWIVSGQFTSLDDPHQTLLACMQAGGARYARKGGKISVITRTSKTSVLTINADDTAGPFELSLHADRLTRVNTVIPRVYQETLEWELTPQDEIQVASYVTDDGGVLPRDIDYPFVAVKSDNTNKDQPAQLAAYAILDSREPFGGTVPLKPWCAEIEPGDVFTVTEPGFLLDGVELLCISRQFDPVNNVVNVTFMSESAGKHAFALGQTNTPPTAPTLTAPDILSVTAPDVADYGVAVGSGNTPTINVTNSIVDSPFPFYEVQTKPTAGSTWSTYGRFDIGVDAVEISGLEPLTSYDIAVRYINEFGGVSSRTVIDTVVTGDTGATNVVSGSTLDTTLDGVSSDITTANQAINDGKRRTNRVLGEIAAAFEEVRESANQAVDENALRKTETTSLSVRTDSAEAGIDSILTLSVDPASALALNTITLRSEFEAEIDPNEPGSLAEQISDRVTLATFNEETATLAEANRSAALSRRRALAETVYSSALANSSTALLVDRERALFARVFEAEVRLGAAEASVSDIITLSVDASSALALNTTGLRAEFEAEIDPEQEGSLANQTVTNAASIVSLDQTTAEADRAQSQRLSRALAEIAAASASAVDATNVLVDDQRSEVTRTTQLRSEFDGVSADVSVLASAYTDGAGNALASFSVVTAASGSNPAIVQLKSGDGASDAAIVADRVMLANLGAGENEVRPVFLAQNGEALFNEQITIYDDIVTPTTAVILGPNIGSDGLTLWAGAASDASSPTLANAQLALGASAGARVDGTVLIDGYEVNRLFTSSPASTRAIIDGDSAGRVICRANIEGVRNLNQWTLIGSNIVFGSPGTGTMGTGDIAIFRFRVFATGPDASPVAENGNFGSLGVTAKQIGGSWDIHLSDTGTISVKSAYISGNPTISVDDFIEEIEQTNVRYTDTGDCYLYFVGFWVSTDATDSAGITLPFTTSTEIAMTNLLNRNTGA